MRRYFDYAIYWDLIIIILIGASLFFFKQQLKSYFELPSGNEIHNFIVSIITVSATLIGFLLTIITVIVTFKKGFDDKKYLKENKQNEDKETTIFDKVITKEESFYNTPIHKEVVNVFVNSTFEIGMLLSILILIQFNILNFSKFTIAVIGISSFILLFLSIIRSLYIFKLFLKTHLK